MNTCDNNCGGGCGGCKPACARPYFNLQADPFSADHWLYEMGTDHGRIKLPTIPVACPKLSINYSNSTFNLAQGECETQTLTGAQLGSIIKMDDLRDVDAEAPDACSLLVFNPGCGLCPCSPDEEMWKKYTIPDAGDCTMEPDSDGYYRVLKKTDCGCITECRLPVMPSGMISLNYMRDSVPDDPDFPWYYGCYNDRINLHLAENAPKYFGKYALKVTINYGIQAILSEQCKNVNFRSLIVPVVDGESINVEKESSILQGFCGASKIEPYIPWGTQALRSSLVFFVPKGKEAYLHHEYRLYASPYQGAPFPGYYENATYDGKIVPDNLLIQPNLIPWNASRLNALQVIIEPTAGVVDYDPVVDPIRSQLDPAEDEYPINSNN